MRWDRGEGCPLTIRLGTWGSVISSPTGVRARAPAENGFYAHLRSERRHLERPSQYFWAMAGPPKCRGAWENFPSFARLSTGLVASWQLSQVLSKQWCHKTQAASDLHKYTNDNLITTELYALQDVKSQAFTYLVSTASPLWRGWKTCASGRYRHLRESWTALSWYSHTDSINRRQHGFS